MPLGQLVYSDARWPWIMNRSDAIDDELLSSSAAILMMLGKL
jgi:hypothetical protein